MSIFKCKICGGTLEFSEGLSVCECQYCGTKQTLPKISDEQNSTLYERADHFRRNNDFDKAIAIYEQILNADNTDAEAYWSLVLCRYGIEYVEDPKSSKRIATVNRMQYTSVLADEDYKSAIKYADHEQREIYEAEAKEIDGIQKGILAISQKEEPFDIFICYKETDNNGRRTPDSVLANELYHQLTAQGFKVFFSRITLEDKLGSAYEPYIFAALNSAKVMVVLGTKPDYFNAVWVKNEWSRFLALIKNGANKVLIPAYRDMDPYDLPEEFSHLQAQDMSKLGFMQDLIRGIEKIVGASKPKYVKEQAVQSGTNTAPLLRRAYLFLEDGDWNSADEYCEKVLDLDPECGEAYLGKLMVQMRVRRREKLGEQPEPFDSNPNYQKAVRFGDDKLKTELEGYTKTIIDRIEHNRLSAIYLKGESIFRQAKSQEDYINASKIFDSIIGFEDSQERANECREKASEMHFSGLYAAAVSLMKLSKNGEDFTKAEAAFLEIADYRDSKALAEECRKKADNANKAAIYAAAVALMNGNKASSYKKAIAEFEKIRGFKDADQKIEYCNKKIEQINEAIIAAGYQKKARAEERALALKEKTDAIKEKLPLIKKIAMVVVPVLVVAILCVTVLPNIDWSRKPSTNIIDNSSVVTSGNGESSDLSENTNSQTSDSSTTANSSKPSSANSNKTENNKPQNTQKPSTDTDTDNPNTDNPNTDNPETNNPGTTEPTPSPPTSDKTSSNDKEAVYGEYTDGDLTFNLTGYEAELIKCSKTAKKIVIPKSVKGCPVTSISSESFRGCADLTSVVIPSGVKTIESQAFYNCKELASVTLPSTLSSIGYRAFGYCHVLESIVLPKSVNYIASGAFMYCDSLESITIPSGVTDINSSAFMFCCSLKSITIPNTVTSIGETAFHCCENLKSINLPNSVTRIDYQAFTSCNALTSIKIPKSVTSIGMMLFAGCTSLSSVTVESGNSKYHSSGNCIIETKTKKLIVGCNSSVIPSDGSITSIGKSAFSCCTNLESVIIPNGVTTIYSNAFGECKNIKSITIPKSVTNIEGLGWQINPSCVLKVYKNSYAHQYAIDADFKYELIG